MDSNAIKQNSGLKFGLLNLNVLNTMCIYTIKHFTLYQLINIHSWALILERFIHLFNSMQGVSPIGCDGITHGEKN